MRKLVSLLGTWMLVAMLAASVFAQSTGRIDGLILDKDGNPWPDQTVTMKNNDTGATYTVKTDKNGKFVQLGMRAGLYIISLPSINYSEKFQVTDTQENIYKLNLKDAIAATAAARPDEAKKREESENKAKNMKAHFDAGMAALTAGNDLRAQIKAAPADQKATLQAQRTTDCETAVTELGEALQNVGEKEVNNRATVEGNLGNADECVGKYDDAAAAFQQALAIKPSVPLYVGLATNLANSAAAATDPKDFETKFADASSNCDKAVALDPVSSAACWKNLGVVLFNKGRMKEAIVPLQKASQGDPKDQTTWYMLGNALANTMDATNCKQEGEKMICIPPPGTTDAYQKCIDAGPENGTGKLCKDALDGLNAASGGQDTSMGTRKKKK